MNEGDHSLEIKMRGLVVFGFIVLLINGTLGAVSILLHFILSLLICRY